MLGVYLSYLKILLTTTKWAFLELPWDLVRTRTKHDVEIIYDKVQQPTSYRMVVSLINQFTSLI